MLTYVKQGQGFRAALVDRAGKELGHGSASTRTAAMTAAAVAAAKAGHKSEATAPGVLKELPYRDAERVRLAAGLQPNPRRRRKAKRKAKKKNPRRPTRRFMKKCVRAVKRKRGRRVKKPGAVCAVTYRRMGRKARKRYAEKKPNPRRRRGMSQARLADAEARGIARAYRAMGFRVVVKRGR